MITDAKKDHINLYKISGFRSYQTQIQLFNNYKARDDEKAANKYSSKPGHSEHQTGLSFDVGAQGSDKTYTAVLVKLKKVNGLNAMQMNMALLLDTVKAKKMKLAINMSHGIYAI